MTRLACSAFLDGHVRQEEPFERLDERSLDAQRRSRGALPVRPRLMSKLPQLPAEQLGRFGPEAVFTERRRTVRMRSAR